MLRWHQAGQATAQSPRCSIHCPRPTCVGVATAVCVYVAPPRLAPGAASAVCGPRSDLREVGWRGAAAGTWQRSTRGAEEEREEVGNDSRKLIPEFTHQKPKSHAAGGPFARIIKNRTIIND